MGARFTAAAGAEDINPMGGLGRPRGAPSMLLKVWMGRCCGGWEAESEVEEEEEAEGGGRAGGLAKRFGGGGGRGMVYVRSTTLCNGWFPAKVPKRFS